MSLPDKIFEHLQELPEAFQAEVLDFVEFLELKAKRLGDDSERDEWSKFSLAQAARDMNEEDEIYTVEDLREVYS